MSPLPWRHNDHDGVSNHQPHGCLLNRLFRRRSKKTSKLCITGLCGPVNSAHKGPVTRKIKRDKYRWFWAELNISGLSLQFEFTNGFEMIYKAWSSIEEVPYCFSRSSIKFQDHMGQKIINFDPNWVFLDCSSSLNSLMGLKWCTKLDVV